MKHLYILLLTPVYFVSYLMLLGWNFPKFFTKLTINTYKYKTKQL